MSKAFSIWKKILRLLPPPQDHVLHDLASRTTILSSEHKDEISSLYKKGSIQDARKLLAAQRYQEAYDMFFTITEENSNSRWAWHGLGDACQLMSCYDDALKSYRCAYDLSKKDVLADNIKKEQGLHLAGIANALTCLGRIEEADLIWKQVIESDPTLLWMKENSKK
jgi:tetratricopeptide (TPR) repeat protein